MLKKQKIGTEHDKSVSTYFNEVASYKPLSKEEADGVDCVAQYLVKI